MLRILMVHNFYQIGGGEHTVFANEKEMLEQNGHAVFEYTRDNRELLTKKWLLFLLPFSMIFSWKTYRELSRIVRDYGIDIVHCHNIFPLISPSVYYAARKLKVPVVQTIHNYRWLCPCGLLYRDGHICEDCLSGSLLPALKHKCYRQSRFQTLAVVLMLWVHRFLKTLNRVHLVFLTAFGKEKYEQVYSLPQENVHIKPNLCPVPTISMGNTPPVDSNKFIYVGRLDENKGILFLLDAWKQMTNAELHIYGDGPLRIEVERAAEQLSNILYFGFCDRQVVQQDLCTACAMIFPSTCYEMFPLAICESYSLGTPAICGDIGNQALLVQNGETGCHYRPGDKSDFLRAISLVRDNNATLRQGAKTYWEENLAPAKNHAQLLSIYEEAIAAP